MRNVFFFFSRLATSFKTLGELCFYSHFPLKEVLISLCLMWGTKPKCLYLPVVSNQSLQTETKTSEFCSCLIKNVLVSTKYMRIFSRVEAS